MEKRKNLEWIDAMRGLVMLMVIFGHIVTTLDPFYYITSPLKMPGFFAISGYLFHYETTPIGKFAVNKTRRLLIPWLGLSAILFLCNILILQRNAGANVFWGTVRDIRDGNVLWYLPCILLCEALFYGLTRLCRQKLSIISAVSVTLLILGLTLMPPYVVLPWHVSALPIVQFYLYLGYAYRHIEERLKKFETWWMLCGLTVLYAALVVGRTFLNGMVLDVNTNRYPVPWMDMILVVVGLLWLCLLCKKLPMPRILLWVGRNTLPLYAFHAPIAAIMTEFVHFVLGAGAALVYWDIYPYLQLVAALIGSALLALLINRFLPFLVGRSYKKRSPHS